MSGALLAIDPGPAESAWVLMAPDGTIVERAKEPNRAVRARLGDMGRGFIVAPRVDFVAIEMIASYGMAVGREVFETCLWIGRFAELCHAVPTRLVYRSEVKSHLCHSQKAKDANIRQALIDKLGPVGTKKAPGPCYGIAGDVWSALAVAVTARETVPPTMR